MSTRRRSAPIHVAERKPELDRRLEEVGWGLLFILTGAVWLVPEEQVPHGTWLLGVGLLLIGLNVARYLAGIRVHRLTSLLGALAMAGGIGEVAGVDLPLVAILLIVIGGSIILVPSSTHRR